MQTGITDQPSPSAPLAAIEYVLTPDDHAACHLHLLDRQLHAGDQAAAGGVSGWTLGVIGVVALAILIYLASQGSVVLAAAWGVLAGGFLAVLALTVRGKSGPKPNVAPGAESAARRQYADRFRAGAELLQGRRDCVELYAEGFVEFNESHEDDGGIELLQRSETRVAWASVESIDVIPTHAIFTVTDKGHLFVPKWAFRDDGTFRAFVETAERLRQAAMHRAAGAFTTAPGRSDAIRPQG
jgi:hypothetical protein